MKTDKKLKILILHRQQSAVGYYRSWTRARALRALGHDVDCDESRVYEIALATRRRRPEDVADWMRAHAHEYDLVFVDRALSHLEWGRFAGFRCLSDRMRMVVDIDDDIENLPSWNASFKGYHPGQEMREAALAHFRNAEMLTTSTSVLAERFGTRAHSALVVPNFVDPADWVNLPVDPTRNDDPHLRVLYGGASGHYGDLDVVKDGLKAVIENPPVPWRLICMGSMPLWLHDMQRKYPSRVVNLPWVPFENYAKAVAWGGFDAAIAPLAQHPFNEAKSNIKWLEAGIQGIPFVGSKVGPYAEIPDGCALRLENNPKNWTEGLRAILEDVNLRRSLAEDARKEILENWTIGGNADLYRVMIEKVMARPRITTFEDTRLPGDPEVRKSAPSEDLAAEPQATDRGSNAESPTSSPPSS